jgi:hypothetical protein
VFLTKDEMNWFNSVAQNDTSIDIWISSKSNDDTYVTDFTIDNPTVLRDLVLKTTKLQLLSRDVEMLEIICL